MDEGGTQEIKVQELGKAGYGMGKALTPLCACSVANHYCVKVRVAGLQSAILTMP